MQHRFTTASPCYMHGILPEEKYWSDGYSTRKGRYKYFAAKDDKDQNMMIIIPCRGDDKKHYTCEVGDTDNPAAGFPDPGTPLIVPLTPLNVNIGYRGPNVYDAQVSESCNVSSKGGKRKKKKTKRTKRKTKRTRRRKRRKTKGKAKRKAR